MTSHSTSLTPEEAVSLDLTRLQVYVNAETADALRNYAAARDVSVTEAVRHAVSLLKYVTDEQERGRAIQSVGRHDIRQLVFPH